MTNARNITARKAHRKPFVRQDGLADGPEVMGVCVEGTGSLERLEVPGHVADEEPEPDEAGERHEDLLPHGRPVQRNDPSHHDSCRMQEEARPGRAAPAGPAELWEGAAGPTSNLNPAS